MAAADVSVPVDNYSRTDWHRSVCMFVLAAAEAAAMTSDRDDAGNDTATRHIYCSIRHIHQAVRVIDRLT